MSSKFVSKLPKTIEEFLDKSKNYKFVLKDADFWSKVPLLNYTSLKDLHEGELVRFRGMVQDMHNPEIYMERYEVHSKQQSGQQVRIQQGKYRDNVILKDNEYVHHEADGNVQGDRRPIVVVALPGLNSWAQQYEIKCNEVVIEKKLTNQMGIDEVAQNEGNNAPSVSKKPKLQNHNNNDNGQCINQVCIVKLYDNFDGYPLNSAVDALGFLSFDTYDAENNEDHDKATSEKPQKCLPRLHAIVVERLSHCNPLLEADLIKTSGVEHSLETPHPMFVIHQELIKFLTMCLCNDTLAAQYLLCHLISTIYNRTEMECVGKFSLNLCSFNKELIPDKNYTKHLYEVLQLLVPTSHYLSMDTTTLNASKFSPNKDYESDKIVTGILQLPDQTQLVLDETRMDVGLLEANGVRGLQDITRLIKEQQITCDFQFYEIQYDVNIPVLVLSEGRSLLPHDFLLPIVADKESYTYAQETLAAAHHYLQTDNRLNKFRQFLTMARTAAFEITLTACEIIEIDFEQMIRANTIQKPAELHAFIVLARLLAITHGKGDLDKETFNLAKTYEAQRKLRVEQLPKSKMAAATAQAILASNGC